MLNQYLLSYFIHNIPCATFTEEIQAVYKFSAPVFSAKILRIVFECLARVFLLAVTQVDLLHFTNLKCNALMKCVCRSVLQTALALSWYVLCQNGNDTTKVYEGIYNVCSHVLNLQCQYI